MRSAFSVSILLVSCAPAPSAEIAADALCDEVVAVVCAADAECCGSEPRRCIETQANECRASLGSLVQDARVGYDRRGGAALAEALRARAAGCWREPVALDAFFGAFSGTGAAGADCTPPDARPESLLVSSLSCARGLACRLYLRADGSPQGECAPRTDDACSHPFDCGPGTFCSLPADWRPGVWGTCRPLRTDGWACSSDLECASRHCEGTCRPAGSAMCLEQRYEDLVLAAGPIAYLRFDETSGTRANDLAGAHAGAIVGGASRDASGAVRSPGSGADAAAFDDGGAVRFESDGAAVRVAAMAELAEAREFSLECWIRPDDVDAVRPILEFHDGMRPGVHVWAFDRGDRLYANFVDRGGSPHTITSGDGALAPGRWQHVVATHDGTTGRLWLDGRLVGEVAAPGPLALDGEFYVGHRPTGDASGSFRGAIDEVAVYARALSPSEIAIHAEAADGGLRRRFPLFRWISP